MAGGLLFQMAHSLKHSIHAMCILFCITRSWSVVAAAPVFSDSLQRWQFPLQSTIYAQLILCRVWKLFTFSSPVG